MTSEHITIFTPHPDDETLGCGGTIVKKICDGFKIIVIVLTDGSNALSHTFGITKDPTPEELGIIRKEEMRKAMNILGVSNDDLFFLNIEDGYLLKSEKKAEEEIYLLLNKNPPVEIYYPSEKDYHLDHRVTSRIVNNVIERINLKIPNYRYSIIQKYARFGPKIDSLLNIYKRNMVSIDISKYLNIKKLALNEYKSQISIFNKNQEHPVVYLDNYIKNKEIFYI